MTAPMHGRRGFALRLAALAAACTLPHAAAGQTSAAADRRRRIFIVCSYDRRS